MERTLFSHLFDLLWSRHGLANMDAYCCISSFVALKILDSKLDVDIDLRQSELFSDWDDRDVLMDNCHLSVLAARQPINIPGMLRDVWDEVLAVHPTTKLFFSKGQLAQLDDGVLVELVTSINNTTFTSSDILGDLYESIPDKALTSSKGMGQFFTPQILRRLMVQLADPKDGDSVFDPTMGTGGLLIEAYRHMSRNGPVGPQTLGGREISVSTAQTAAINMLATLGYLPEQVMKGDSIQEPITSKWDIVLANPPFSTYNYESISPEGRQLVPIRTNRRPLIFLQIMISILKEGGKCVVVLPSGQDIFSSDCYEPRKYLMETCTIKEVVSVNIDKVFKNTGSSTIVLHFVKGGRTDSVTFSSFDGSTKTYIRTVTNMADKRYSLQEKDYRSSQQIVEDQNANVLLIKLGELARMDRGKQLPKCKAINGPYPVIGGGREPTCYHNDYNREANTILCSSSGTSGHISMYSTPVWASDCFSIVPVSQLIDNRYLYHVLKSKQEELYSLRSGLGPSHVYPKDLADLDIPVPPMDEQLAIVSQAQEIQQEIEQLTAKLKNLEVGLKNKIDSYLQGPVRRLSVACSPVVHSPVVHSPKVVDDSKVINPKTNRKIAVGGKVYNALITEGYVHDEASNRLVLPNQ